MQPASTLPNSTLPIPPPARLLDERQLREWLAALRDSSVLPCRQTIRDLRNAGMPAANLTGTWVYDPSLIWDWIQGRMVGRNIRQQAIDAACLRSRRTSQVS